MQACNADSRESGVWWVCAGTQLEHGVFVGLFLTGQKLAESELAGLARFAGEREYTWVDAFRTSLLSNSQAIADLFRRFADLDLTA